MNIIHLFNILLIIAVAIVIILAGIYQIISNKFGEDNKNVKRYYKIGTIISIICVSIALLRIPFNMYRDYLDYHYPTNMELVPCEEYNYIDISKGSIETKDTNGLVYETNTRYYVTINDHKYGNSGEWVIENSENTIECEDKFVVYKIKYNLFGNLYIMSKNSYIMINNLDCKDNTQYVYKKG